MGMKNLRLRKGIKKVLNGMEKAANDTENEKSYSDTDAAKDVDWLKSTLVNEKNMSEIKRKIKLTSTHRKKTTQRYLKCSAGIVSILFHEPKTGEPTLIKYMHKIHI